MNNNRDWGVEIKLKISNLVALWGKLDSLNASGDGGRNSIQAYEERSFYMDVFYFEG